MASDRRWHASVLHAGRGQVGLVRPGDGRDPNTDPWADPGTIYSISPAEARALAAELKAAADAIGKPTAASLQTTLFTCRNCSVCVRGWVDGTVSEHGWHRIERIDGPNFLCPVCVADDPIEELRDEYPNAVVGGLVEVRDGE